MSIEMNKIKEYVNNLIQKHLPAKTNEKNKHFNKINDCGNNHIFISRYLFKKW